MFKSLFGEKNVTVDETPVVQDNKDYVFSNNKIKSDGQNIVTDKVLIEIKHLSKTFEKEDVLNDINITIFENEFVTFLGPSGCGKTTILRTIAGFLEPTSGEIIFDNQSLFEIPSYKRPINTVFQKYALFPHMNVFENIAFGLRIKKLSFDVIQDKVSQMLKLVKLQGYEKRHVNSLSGGQQQRVAIARALVNEPKLLLLDEPLAALDLKLRQEMQYELKEMQRQTGITFIYVTHDQEEALTMSDKIVVLNNGVIQQIGKPTDIYNEPKNRFVANFIGESNIIEGKMCDDYWVEFENHLFPCVDKGFKRNEIVDVVIRPEDLIIMDKDQAPIQGVVDSIIFKGVHYEICCIVGGTEYVIHNTKYVNIGDIIGIDVDKENIHIMKKEVQE